MKKGLFAELPQMGINCKYEIGAKGIMVTTYLSIPNTLGEAIGYPIVNLSADQTLIQLKNQWFIKNEHLFTWSEIEEVGIYNLYYKLMNEARQSKRYLMEYHKNTILEITWESINLKQFK